MKPTSTVRLLILWELCEVPCIALAAGSVLAVFGSSGSFFSLPPSASFVIGAGYGGIYALLRSVPHFFALYLWVMLSRFFGDVDVTRTRLAIAMTVWALPEAIIFAELGGGDAFFPVLFVLALGAWLPRALVPPLRPGVFQEPNRS